MKRLNFETTIKASPEKVWSVLWDDRTYRIWTGVHGAGAYYVTDWKEGGRIRFLNGKGQGMYSVIEENRPYERMTFRHLGEVRDGQEIPFNGSTAPSTLEIFTLTYKNGITTLKIETDAADEYVEYMERTFPESLKKIKELSEAK